MTTYRIIVLLLIASSILMELFDLLSADKKGSIYLLQRLFMAITLLIVLAIGYRAFYLVR